MRISDFSIHRDAIGSLQHVAYSSGKIVFCDDLVTSGWVYDKSEGNLDCCLKTLLRVNGIQIEYNPGTVQKKVYEKLFPEIKCVPWSICLPPRLYKNTIQNFLKSICLMDLDDFYYQNVYKSFLHVARSLKPFRVDVEKMRVLFEDANDSLMSHLESFLPGKDGLVQPPTYNFFGTRTGRLTVSAGPMVLTLPKECRSILSPNEGCKIVQIDFSSLEPRFLAALAKIRPTEGDFYEEISRLCFSGNLSRDKTKIALLGILYGMSADTLSENIKLPVEECKEILGTVKKHFRVKEILSKIDREITGTVVRNYFGKIIEINPQSRLNNYVQSSGIDVVHMGFSKFLSDAEFMNFGFRPMFLVHDALVGEIPESKISSLQKLVDKGYRCQNLDAVFPLALSTFAK